MELQINSSKINQNPFYGNENQTKDIEIMKELSNAMGIPHELVENICGIANKHGGYYKIYQLFEQEFEDWEKGRY